VSLNYNEAARLIRMGRRAEKRGKAVQGFVAWLLAKVANDALTGWMLMLAVGVAHADWIHKLPTIGYWWAVLLVALTRPLFAAGPKSQDKT
jgi:hypothetical protein